jgi:hypothetical protein
MFYFFDNRMSGICEVDDDVIVSLGFGIGALKFGESVVVRVQTCVQSFFAPSRQAAS